MKALKFTFEAMKNQKDSSSDILIKCKNKTIGKLSSYVYNFTRYEESKWLISFNICDKSKEGKANNFEIIELRSSFETLEETKEFLKDHNYELFQQYDFYDIDNMTSLEESIKIK